MSVSEQYAALVDAAIEQIDRHDNTTGQLSLPVVRLATIMLWLEHRDGCGGDIRRRFRDEIRRVWEECDDPVLYRQAVDEAKDIYAWIHSNEAL